MRTATFTPPAPVMPAAWPATNRVRPVKKRIPDTTDGPKRIGYYLEALRGVERRSLKSGQAENPEGFFQGNLCITF